MLGILWIVIRSFSSFPEATAFAILLGNTFGPLFDEAVTALEQRKKAGASVQAVAADGGQVSEKRA